MSWALYANREIKIMNIILLGDSIFDNESYVDSGDSVKELLQMALPNSNVTLLAVDGDVTTDVHKQLESFPSDATCVFVSCGGNDALRNISFLDNKTSSIGESLDLLHGVIEEFRENYTSMLKAVLGKHSKVFVCTIYNKVPGLSGSAVTALALYNETILEILSQHKIPILDLRVICSDERDYSKISPIEPSRQGGGKIVREIVRYVGES